MTYVSKGILETEQETIIATRNVPIVQTDVVENTSRLDTSSRVIRVRAVRNIDQEAIVEPGGTGPLAQTFLVDDSGGCFITSVDLYVETKDAVVPMWVEIRNVVNGYPGPKVLPFGRKLLQPADINVSSDASVATTFTFDSPVYLKEGSEYCIVIYHIL